MNSDNKYNIISTKNAQIVIFNLILVNMMKNPYTNAAPIKFFLGSGASLWLVKLIVKYKIINTNMCFANMLDFSSSCVLHPSVSATKLPLTAKSNKNTPLVRE